MKFLLILVLIVLQSACLKAKKSAFDFNSPAGFPFAFFLFNSSQLSSNFSIGGNITGFTSGTMILQLNGKSDLSLSPTSSYLFGNVPSGSFVVSVKSHPIGLSCALSNHTGTLNSNINNANIICTNFVAQALYNLGDTTKSYWLDYVKSNGTSPIDASGIACDPATENGFYNACIHAGEFKKFIIPNFTSCDGIKATDSLNTLNWNCFVLNSVVNIISTGLRDDKGLSDLIDFTNPGSWRNISLTVTKDGTTLLNSSPSKWWDNPILEQNGGANLNVQRTIYIVNSGTSTGSDYGFIGIKKALLVKPGILKPFTVNVNIDLPNGANFNWIEGSFQAGTIALLHFSGGPNKFNVVRKFRGIGSAGITINTAGTTASFFHDVSGTNQIVTGGSFIKIGNTSSDKNIFNNITAYNVSDTGIEINSFDSIFLNFLAFNTSGHGITDDATENLISINSTSANNSGNSISFGGTKKGTIINSLGVNSNSNFGLFNLASSNTLKLINLILAFNPNMIMNVFSDITTVYLGITNFTSAICTMNTSPNHGLTNTCVKQFGSLVANSFATITNASTPSFVGKVTTTDSKNTSNTIGISASTPTDWINFENRFRGWGKSDANPFPNTIQTGRCVALSNCQIWDWSLKSTDSVARNVNHCPLGSITDTHRWSASTQALCNNFKGAVFTGPDLCITTFLRNAIEIFGDGIGNENGICESNEECMYTPNIGAYQGHSSDITNPSKLIRANESSSSNTTNICQDITTGTVNNVKLWKFDTNGR